MALTENTRIDLIPDVTYRDEPVASGAIIFYKGAILNLNASGYVKLGSDTAGELFAGIGQEELDQASGGSDGDNEMKLLRAGSNVAVKLPITGVTQADLGSDVYVSDDDAVALSTTNSVRVGSIFSIQNCDANEAWILLD